MFLKKYFQIFAGFDWILFASVILLWGVGLLVHYSLAVGAETPDFSDFRKQLIFGIIGLVLLIFLALIDYRFWKIYAWPLYLVSLVLLIAVLIFGQTIRGARGWFNFGWFNFQPVELAKLFFLVFLSKYLTEHLHEIKRFKTIVVSGLIAFFPFVLAAIQPELGGAIIFFLLWLIIIILARPRPVHLALILGLIIFLAAGFWFFALHDYQKNRIITFVNPSADPLGRGYNLAQSIIAVGSGQVMGRGLTLGSQSQLRFLPERETDFIFAVTGEELGFLGVTFLLALFFILLFQILKITRQTRDNFSQFLAVGIGALLFLELFINIGMNIGLLPVTGITLPFLSYGGSSLITLMMTAGVVLSIRRRSGS